VTLGRPRVVLVHDTVLLAPPIQRAHEEAEAEHQLAELKPSVTQVACDPPIVKSPVAKKFDAAPRVEPKSIVGEVVPLHDGLEALSDDQPPVDEQPVMDARHDMTGVFPQESESVATLPDFTVQEHVLDLAQFESSTLEVSVEEMVGQPVFGETDEPKAKGVAEPKAGASPRGEAGASPRGEAAPRALASPRTGAMPKAVAIAKGAAKAPGMNPVTGAKPKGRTVATPKVPQVTGVKAKASAKTKAPTKARVKSPTR